MNKISEKINASIILGSYFDTVGFYNSNWKFNYNFKKGSREIIYFINNEMVYQYLLLNNMNIKSLNSSDNTILMILTAKATLNGGSLKDYINEYTKNLKLLEDEKRYSKVTTVNSLKQIKKTKDITKLNYNDNMTGNGAAIRTCSIGLIYYKENQLNSLIEKSIQSSRITHNHTIGFLGGLVTALFTSYAMRNIDPWKWCDHLIKLYESNKIDNFIKKTEIYDKYLLDKDSFWNKWYEYREKYLSKIKDKNINFFNQRLEILKNFSPHIHPNNPDYSKLGSSGLCSVIFAYDSILLSINIENKKNNFNTTPLIIFSSIHTGDNNSTGIIAGCWFGALNGFYDFDVKKMEQLEFYKELKNISNKIIKKIK
jgi:ADP-ribosylarginine hydrolase